MSDEPNSLAREIINAIKDGTITPAEVADTTPIDPTWLTTAVEAAKGPTMDAMIEDGPDGHTDGHEVIARAAILAALPEITCGVADAVDDYADAVIDLIDSQNGARLAFEKIGYDLRNFGSGVAR